MFSIVFPGVSFENPMIHHTIDGVSEFDTTKREIMDEGNYNLFKAWQIVMAIVASTSILEHYLHEVATSIAKEEIPSLGIFGRFKDKTGINIVEFHDFQRLRHFCEVRNISIHNLGRINERFKKKTADPQRPIGPYVFYPKQLREYRDLCEEFLSFVESKLPENKDDE
jgi:hypothetical protein